MKKGTHLQLSKNRIDPFLFIYRYVFLSFFHESDIIINEWLNLMWQHNVKRLKYGFRFRK